MEMWLRQAEDRFRFPVFPSSFSINGKAAVNSSSILKIGEIATFGGVALKSISISSFFPNKDYTFCDYTGFPSPYDCVNKIEKWMKEGFILRFRFLYKGIIINHNKKPSQPTLKRRFFKKKAAFFHGPVWERSGADFILKRKGEFF